MTGRLSGKGKVYKGQQFIADVQYEHRTLSKYQENRTPDGKTSRLLVSQKVQLQISPASAISGHFGVDRLTLHMNDGRKQDFFVSTGAGSCMATGGPY